MSVLFYTSISLTLFISFIDAFRILAVFPVPSISHQIVFRPITQELVRRGHDVTVITTDPAFPKGKTPPNLTEIDVHDISYEKWTKTIQELSRTNKGESTGLEILLHTVISAFEAQIKTDEVQKILNTKDNKYDLLLLEACARPALAFTHVFKAPAILVSSFGASPGNFDVFGASEHPILYPSVVRRKLYNLTMWDKITELYSHYETKTIFENLEILENQILTKYFGPDIPTVRELGNNVDMLMLNVNPVFVGSQPVPPSVIFMGGLHQNPEKPLPAEIKKLLDSSKNGVIYVSFGTNIDSSLLPAERVQILVNVFSKLPYDVLLKWDDEELPGRTDNIKISKWLPQSDLLKHPKVKAFITQGGLQSTDEAITAGVPLIGIPMLADQWYNVEKYVLHGIGVQLHLGTLTEEELTNAINKVVGDESYRRNVIKLRTLMTDQPMKPLERAMWWIEYVLRHKGAKHLRSPAANISWTQYLELELVFTVLAALLFVFIIIIIGLFLVYNYCIKGVSIKLKYN